ncbi:hypothetical protein AXK56_16760 [Tsukamurella pulmonis]|uniref:Uncharacterized protein n=1 Tax=Tsukamurella pulmonis TaxID=47312 RepID=A0A1H1ACV7_9ACTN|nr:hypothetical protein [Tsukamurella pulmonis]KXO95861.1 hypothetical protein AXK56_16760 [Tsukamurella pulmonis]SDQ37459.1 hypothetical protein SAMN04489765_0162 [Tsukamurella pulmonis]SUQ39374.1 Uncharacterised protein [Tsukamurella pulmonis]
MTGITGRSKDLGSADFGDPAAAVVVEARRDGRAVRIRVGETVAVLTPAQAYEAAAQLDGVLDELSVAAQVRTPARLMQARVARHLDGYVKLIWPR